MWKWLIKFKILMFILCGPFFKVQANTELKPWIYFDLGDTIIDTKDMKKLKYFKGAKDYLSELKRKGFHIGLITNIPETFGTDYSEKLETLKKLIHDGWIDNENFDWEVFDQVILPMKNTEMKPAPTLFIKALQSASGCPTAYIGENEKEIVAAKGHGFATKLFNQQDSELYVPSSQVKSFLRKEYGKTYEEECFDQVD